MSVKTETVTSGEAFRAPPADAPSPTAASNRSMSISVVVPCYRSAATLPALVTRLCAALPAATTAYEVILVVDGADPYGGAGDDTWTVAASLAARHQPVRAIRLARNYGQHSALMAGIRAARYEVTVTMDDDLQHPPEEVPTLLAALTDEVDLVYGVPVAEEHGALRSLASRVVKAALAGMMGVRNARLVGAFRAFHTVLRQGFETANGPHASVDVSLFWATSRIAGVPVPMAQRAAGRSGYTFRGLLRHTMNMLLGYSTVPLRFVTWTGFLVGLGGIVLFLRLLWLYYNGDTTIAGFTTIASMVALFSAALMIAIGVLGEYIGRIHSYGTGQPGYVIREQTDGPAQNPGHAGCPPEPAASSPEYEFDDDPARVDRKAVWSFMRDHAYWGRWRDQHVIERQIDASWRVVGVYERVTGRMIGFARAVSDGVSVAYLADVFIHPDHRGNGLGVQLVRTIVDHGPGSHFRWMLHTGDAHGLYRKAGFRAPNDTYLERPGGAPRPPACPPPRA